jgi:hypothetical protein
VLLKKKMKKNETKKKKKKKRGHRDGLGIWMGLEYDGAVFNY